MEQELSFEQRRERDAKILREIKENFKRMKEAYKSENVDTIIRAVGEWQKSCDKLSKYYPPKPYPLS